jgi:hypothetical protein
MAKEEEEDKNEGTGTTRIPKKVDENEFVRV